MKNLARAIFPILAPGKSTENIYFYSYQTKTGESNSNLWKIEKIPIPSKKSLRCPDTLLIYKDNLSLKEVDIMRKSVPIMIVLFSILLSAGLAQDLSIALPQGEGYAVKKDPPSGNARWELKLFNQSSPLTGERIILSPESFYLREVLQGAGAQQLMPTPIPVRQAMFDESFGERYQGRSGTRPGLASPMATPAVDENIYPVNRIIRPLTPDDARQQLKAFLDSYNDVLLNSLPNEPIQFVIDRAAWQYWYNQMILWEEFVEKDIFLKKMFTKSMDKLNFSSKDALNSSVATVANIINDDAQKANTMDRRKNFDFLGRLELRENRRKDYRQWLEDQKQIVVDFTRAWARKENQQEITIDGTVYLLSSEPMENVPRNTVNVVSQELTPYDILNADGTLKKPVE